MRNPIIIVLKIKRNIPQIKQIAKCIIKFGVKQLSLELEKCGHSPFMEKYAKDNV